jgi:sugar phosphate isomerase/epimerase
MKFGLSTWSLLRSDLYSAIAAIGDAGFDYIELWGEVPHAYHDWIDRRRLKDALSAYSFTKTMHAPFTDLNPATPFDPVKGAVAKTLKDFVRFSEDLGAVRITLHPGSVHSGALVSQSMADAVSLLNKLVKESSGTVGINVENQPRSHSHYHFPVGDNPESIQALLSNVEGSSYTLDTGHAHVNGDKPLRLFERFSADVTEIHLHDNGGSEDEHLFPGSGTAGLDGLLERVKGTEVLVCLEANPFKYSADEVIRTATRFKESGHF